MLEPATRFYLAAILLLTPAAALCQTGYSTPGSSTRPAANQAAVGQVGLPWAQSAWAKGYNSSTRLLAGAKVSVTGPEAARGRTLLAGVEIRMSEGWKTYWRHPGDDGGIPPSFDWTGSLNLKSARVLYPVPERLKSAGGASIGYTRATVFPVEIEAADPALPVVLSLTMDYGICREICVPAEARLQLQIPPLLAAMPPDLEAALGRVPRVAGASGVGGQPGLEAASAVLSGPSPGLTFEIAAAIGARLDLFVEAPDGLYLPMTIKTGDAGAGIQRFRIDLKGIEDVAKLAGKTLRLTIAGPDGGVEARWLVR